MPALSSVAIPSIPNTMLGTFGSEMMNPVLVMYSYRNRTRLGFEMTSTSTSAAGQPRPRAFAFARRPLPSTSPALPPSA